MTAIHGWTAGDDGCAFYRIALPFSYLKRRGHNVSVGINLPAGIPSVLVAQRTANPHASRLFQHMVRNNDVLGIYEIDDDVFSIPKTSSAHEGWSYVDDLTAVEANASAARYITVSTTTLGEVFEEFNPGDVHVLPNTVPGVLLDQQGTGTGKVRVGWGGSSTHSDDWQPFADAIHEEVNAYRAELAVTGPNYTGHTKGVVLEPWCATVPDWWQRVASFDIGLAPLVDSVFNRSKSFVKILEYAALGVPFIASPVGPYAEHVVNGENGYLAETPEEWAYYLRALIRSSHLRTAMGNKAREWAAQWTTELHIRKWEELYLNG